MKNLSVRTKLMLMMLFVTILACAVLGYLGSRYGDNAIKAEAISQLNLIRSSKEEQITAFFENNQHFVEVMGQNETIIRAAQDFKRAFRILNNDTLPKSCTLELGNYYEAYMQKLAENMEIKEDIMLYLPKSTEACYLQYEYIVNNPNPAGQKENLSDADDGSEYSQVHAEHHRYFQFLKDKYDYYDVFIVDLETGDIIYTAEKEMDFATNLYSGPYRGSNLARLARSLQTSAFMGEATFQDFEPYLPSFGAPAGFVGIPLTIDGNTVAGLIFQIPIDEIDKIMTNNGDWEEDGLGMTGEAFLVGPDEYMRSVSRFYLQDSLQYKKELEDMQIPQNKIDNIFRYGSTVMQQKIDSDYVKNALNGKSGYAIEPSYRGEEVLTTYEPLNIMGFNWVIVAEKDLNETLQPVKEFDRQMLIQTLILVLIITFIAMLLSRLFVKPINQLTDSAELIIAGDTDHRVNIDSRDEFGEMANSFNSMMDKLHLQQEQLQEQSKFNSELLNNFIPTDYVERLKKGEKAFAQEYSNVTLILIDVLGFDTLVENEGADVSVKLLTDITEAFDEAAKNNEVERIKIIGEIYLAACGLFEPRLDHTNRSIVFAKEAQKIIKQINIDHGTDLKLRICVKNGDVIGGIIGRKNFSFDIWGPAVNDVYKMNEFDAIDKIIVLDDARERLVELYNFDALKEKMEDGRKVYQLKDKKK